MPEHPEPKARPHPWTSAGSPASRRRCVASSLSAYTDLHVTSNFSFLRGASHPEELVARAAALGHEAVAVTDVNTLAGIVRAELLAELADRGEPFSELRLDHADLARSSEVFLTNTSGRLIPVVSVLGVAEGLPGVAGERWQYLRKLFEEREDGDRAAWEARRQAQGVFPNAPSGLE